MTKTRRLLLSAVASSLLFLAACAGLPDGGENRPPAEADAAVLAGTWEGELYLEDQKLDIVIRFMNSDPITGSIDIPQQDARGLRLDDIRLSVDSVCFELADGRGSALFFGELEGDLIMGTFTRSGTRGTFVLARGSQLPGASR